MELMERWVEAVHRKLEAERAPGDPPSRLFPPARPEQLAALEAELGGILPRSYRWFLECSDGWTGFWFGMSLLGTAGPARAALEVELAEAMEAGPGHFAGVVVLGANAEEDLYMLFDPGEEEPKVEIYSIGDGTLEVFDSFAQLLEMLSSGERLPRTVPLDLEAQFRPWEEDELLQDKELEELLGEESGPEPGPASG